MKFNDPHTEYTNITERKPYVPISFDVDKFNQYAKQAGLTDEQTATARHNANSLFMQTAGLLASMSTQEISSFWADFNNYGVDLLASGEENREEFMRLEQEFKDYLIERAHNGTAELIQHMVDGILVRHSIKDEALDLAEGLTVVVIALAGAASYGYRNEAAWNLVGKVPMDYGLLPEFSELDNYNNMKGN